MELPEEEVQRLRIEAQSIRNLFLSPDGQKVLGILEDLFDGSNYSDNPIEMAYKCGQRDVYLMIKEILEEVDNG